MKKWYIELKNRFIIHVITITINIISFFIISFSDEDANANLFVFLWVMSLNLEVILLILEIYIHKKILNKEDHKQETINGVASEQKEDKKNIETNDLHVPHSSRFDISKLLDKKPIDFVGNTLYIKDNGNYYRFYRSFGREEAKGILKTDECLVNEDRNIYHINTSCYECERSIFVIDTIDNAKKEGIKICPSCLEYKERKLKLKTDDGSVEYATILDYVSKDEYCIISSIDKYYHKSLSCPFDFNDELQVEKIEKEGFEYIKFEDAKHRGKCECPKCFDKLLSDGYKYGRLIKSGEYIEFTAVRTFSQKRQDLLQDLKLKQRISCTMDENGDYYLYAKAFDWKKSEFIPIGYIPSGITENELIYADMDIFVHELIKDQNGRITLRCITKSYNKQENITAS